MTYGEFQVAIFQLAQRGLRLTVPNVVASLAVEPAQAEEWLDQMVGESRLEVEVQEEGGAFYYRVPGLTVQPPVAWSPPPSSAPAASTPRRKSVAVAGVLGLLLPGAGLLYAAPWSAAAVATLAIFVVVHMFAALPLLGWLLSSIALGVCALASALLGVLYARRYNSRGRRTHLPAPSSPEWELYAHAR